MTDLQTQAREYAKRAIKVYATPMLTAETKEAIAEAYAQGWADRDTRDMKPETQDEFFNGE